MEQHGSLEEAVRDVKPEEHVVAVTWAGKWLGIFTIEEPMMLPSPELQVLQKPLQGKVVENDVELTKYLRHTPMADTTYESYRRKWRKAKLKGDVALTQRLEAKFRLSNRPIPTLDVLAPGVYETPSGLSTNPEGAKPTLTDAAYQAYCVNLEKARLSGDQSQINLWEGLISVNGREVPRSGTDRRQTRQDDGTLPTPPSNDARHGLDD